MREQIGDVTLIHGDCLDVMPTLKAGSVSLVFADLPYGVLTCKWDVQLPLPVFWEKAMPLVSSNYAFVFTATQPFASLLVVSNMQAWKHDIVWQKVKSSGLHASLMPLRSHEHVLVFGSKKMTYNPQKIAGKHYAHSGSIYDSAWHGKTMVKKESRRAGAMRFPKSIIAVCEQDIRTDTLHGHKPSRVHPTQKPVALLEWLIRTYTNDGDTILDPVAGSATTAIAAMRVGNRKVICIEKDPVYFEAMVKRVTDERAKLGMEPM